MAQITIRRTPIVLKNGKKDMKGFLEEKEWEFCDSLWSIIKEYAGIYNFNINWEKVLLKNQSYLLQPIICFTFTDEYDNVKELSCWRFKKNEDIVRRQFWKKVNKCEFKKSWLRDWGECNKKIVLEMLFNVFGGWTLPKEFQVGDEIQFDGKRFCEERAGVIISIAKNRTSYKIREYSYCNKRLDDRYYQSRNSYHYIWDWDKTNTKISTIKSDKSLKRELTNPRSVSS